MTTINDASISDDPQNPLAKRPLIGWLISDLVVFIVVLINSAAILLTHLPAIQATSYINLIQWVDYACSVYFVIEASLKIWILGFRNYWQNGWNKLDFAVVLSSLPLLLNPFLSVNLEAFGFVSLLRLGRFLRFLRSLRLIRFINLAKSFSKATAACQAPIIALFAITGIYLFLDSLALPEWIAQWNSRGFSFLIILAVTWLIARLYNVIEADYLLPWVERTESTFDNFILPLVKVGVKLLVWAIGLVIAVENAGYDASAIVASLGIGGLAFALAAQDTIANIFGGITVHLQKPFKVGDRVEVSGINGWVQEVGLRSSTIKDFYGKVISLPNRTFTTNPLTNLHARPHYLIEVPLRLHYETTAAQLELALNILEETVRDSDLVEDTCLVNFDKIDDYSFNIELIYFVKKMTQEDKEVIDILPELNKINRGRTQVNLEIMKRFEANNIRLALPIQVRPEVPFETNGDLNGRQSLFK